MNSNKVRRAHTLIENLRKNVKKNTKKREKKSEKKARDPIVSYPHLKKGQSPTEMYPHPLDATMVLEYGMSVEYNEGRREKNGTMNESELTHCESSHTEDRHQTYRANTMRKRIKKIERTYNNKKKKEIYIMYIETHTHTQ